MSAFDPKRTRLSRPLRSPRLRDPLSQVTKLIAKRARSPLAMSIDATAFLLDVLFDFSSHDCREARRRKNAFDDIGGRTRSLIAVEHNPGGASAHPKCSRLLGGRIKPTGY